MEYKQTKLNIILTLIFLGILISVQAPFILSNQLGVLQLYSNNPIAFNELTFWSQYQSDVYSMMNYSNPMLFNLIGTFIYISSKFFSSKIIFTVFPIFFAGLSFFLFLKVLDNYNVPKNWSILLAFLGITSSTSSTLWSSLSAILLLDFEYFLKVEPHFDLLISLSHSISLAVFLFLLMSSFRLYQVNYDPPRLLGVLWGLSIFVHPAIFIFGVSFIFLNLLVRFLILKKRGETLAMSKFSGFFILPILIALPYIFLHLTFYENPTISVNSFGDTFFREVLSYYFVPFGLMYVSSGIFKIDPYQVTKLYLPILLLAIVEFAIRVLARLNFFGFDIDLIIDNIAINFLHFFYYVPVITILTRKSYYEFKELELMQRLQFKARKMLFHITLFAYFPILVILIFSIIFPALTKDISSSDALENKMNLVSAHQSTKIPSERLTVYADMEANILSNYLYKDMPFLNNYLIHGDNKFSDFHMFFLLHYFKLGINFYSPFNFEDSIGQDKVSINTNLLNWLIYNRSRPNSFSTKERAASCPDVFFNSFNLVATKSFISEMNNFYPSNCKVFLD